MKADIFLYFNLGRNFISKFENCVENSLGILSNEKMTLRNDISSQIKLNYQYSLTYFNCISILNQDSQTYFTHFYFLIFLVLIIQIYCFCYIFYYIRAIVFQSFQSASIHKLKEDTLSKFAVTPYLSQEAIEVVLKQNFEEDLNESILKKPKRRKHSFSRFSKLTTKQDERNFSIDNINNKNEYAIFNRNPSIFKKNSIIIKEELEENENENEKKSPSNLLLNFQNNFKLKYESTMPKIKEEESRFNPEKSKSNLSVQDGLANLSTISEGNDDHIKNKVLSKVKITQCDRKSNHIKSNSEIINLFGLNEKEENVDENIHANSNKNSNRSEIKETENTVVNTELPVNLQFKEIQENENESEIHNIQEKSQKHVKILNEAHILNSFMSKEYNNENNSKKQKIDPKRNTISGSPLSMNSFTFKKYGTQLSFKEKSVSEISKVKKFSRQASFDEKSISKFESTSLIETSKKSKKEKSNQIKKMSREKEFKIMNNYIRDSILTSFILNLFFNLFFCCINCFCFSFLCLCILLNNCNLIFDKKIMKFNQSTNDLYSTSIDPETIYIVNLQFFYCFCNFLVFITDYLSSLNFIYNNESETAISHIFKFTPNQINNQFLIKFAFQIFNKVKSYVLSKKRFIILILVIFCFVFKSYFIKDNLIQYKDISILKYHHQINPDLKIINKEKFSKEFYMGLLSHLKDFNGKYFNSLDSNFDFIKLKIIQTIANLVDNTCNFSDNSIEFTELKESLIITKYYSLESISFNLHFLSFVLILICATLIAKMMLKFIVELSFKLFKDKEKVLTITNAFEYLSHLAFPQMIMFFYSKNYLVY